VCAGDIDRVDRYRGHVTGFTLGAVLGLVLVLVLAALVGALARVLRLPAHHPAAALARVTVGKPKKRTVAFVGASIIHGRVSANLPERVRTRLAADGIDIDVVNAGLNGDLAWNALQRADTVLACAPDDVIVLVGSNDVMGSLTARDARRYRVGKKLPQLPDLEFFRSSMDALLAKLIGSGARVAVCTLPMLGEDLGAPQNERVRLYNEVIRERAATHGATLLDVFGALAAELTRRGGHRRDALLGGKMLLPMLLRGATGMSFSRIGSLFGFVLLADGVHLSEPAADLVATHMADFLSARQTETPSRRTFL
jgi:acyl-CoA thioesterase I